MDFEGTKAKFFAGKHMDRSDIQSLVEYGILQRTRAEVSEIVANRAWSIIKKECNKISLGAEYLKMVLHGRTIDCGKMFKRARKIVHDRNVLLEACKQTMDLLYDGEDADGDMILRVIATAEEKGDKVLYKASVK